MSQLAGAARIVVDGSKCDGHGICALVLPERLSLDPWGYASHDHEPIEDPGTLARAKRAVSACPAQALTLVGPVGPVGPVGAVVRVGRGNRAKPWSRDR